MKRHGKTIFVLSVLCLALGRMAAAAPAVPDVPGHHTTVVLADPEDPYHALAQEIAQDEGLDLYQTLDAALAVDPAFLLWVASPTSLSYATLNGAAEAMQARTSAVAMGIITGTTLDRARALWLRADQVEGEHVVSAQAANRDAHIEAGITEVRGTLVSHSPLSSAGLYCALQEADYVMFTGHGGPSYLRIDSETTLRTAGLPELDAAVVATGSCNTFRPWDPFSIALAIVDRGAAAYAGFMYSPNEGFLFGEFGGVPFRYTWPQFAIGHVVQIQNRGALQGFAAFPYYFLLGDPRIALQTAPAYRLAGSHSSPGAYTLDYDGAPAGLIPVRVPGGAEYPFVHIPGVGAAWRGEPFYNARVQMIDVGDDKLVMFDHVGGSFQLQLHASLPWPRILGDVLGDALDTTLLFLQDSGGALLCTIAGILAIVPALFLLRRRKTSRRALAQAAAVGLVFAVLHASYALLRVDAQTITSKPVAFDPLAPVGTFLLVGAGAFYYRRARSWRGRAVAVGIATLPALGPGLGLIAALGIVNNLSIRPRLGVELWNYRLGLQPLIVFAVGAPLLGSVFHILGRGTNRES